MVIMNSVITQSALVIRALEFLQEKILETGVQCSQALLDEAAMRYNLSPAEAQTLEHIFREKKQN